MDFLQGRSVETMAAVAVALVAVAVGGAFLLRRSKRTKGMLSMVVRMFGRSIHACLHERRVRFVRDLVILVGPNP